MSCRATAPLNRCSHSYKVHFEMKGAWNMSDQYTTWAATRAILQTHTLSKMGTSSQSHAQSALHNLCGVACPPMLI